MDIRDIVAKMSAKLLKGRGKSLSLSTKPIRTSLADIPLKPRQGIVHRPSPPVRPASNM
jgi:hypothetical protein